MKVAVTGSEGKVGRALIGQLDTAQFEITSLDLPAVDATDLDNMMKATVGHDALIHFAWRGVSKEGLNNVHPDNGIMYENAYRAAVANNIGLVIMGSSNHAHDHKEREADGKIRYTGAAETANNLYGVEKQKMEAMGRYFAKSHGLVVLCLRIGNINNEDAPRPNDEPRRWQSHRDFGQLVTKALTHGFEPGHFEVMYSVSKQPVFDWENSFDYEPVDVS